MPIPTLILTSVYNFELRNAESVRCNELLGEHRNADGASGGDIRISVHYTVGALYLLRVEERLDEPLEQMARVILENRKEQLKALRNTEKLVFLAQVSVEFPEVVTVRNFEMVLSSGQTIN